MKIFKLQCTVGEYNTEAEGPSKKDAKRKAAELMLPKLKELPPVAAKVLTFKSVKVCMCVCVYICKTLIG